MDAPRAEEAPRYPYQDRPRRRTRAERGTEKGLPGTCKVCGGARTDQCAMDCRRCRFTDLLGRQIRPRCILCQRFVNHAEAMHWPVRLTYRESAENPDLLACWRCKTSPVT